MTNTVQLASTPGSAAWLRGVRLLEPILFSVRALSFQERRMYPMEQSQLIPCAVSGCPDFYDASEVLISEILAPVSFSLWATFIEELLTKERIRLFKPARVKGTSSSARFICRYHRRQQQVEVVRKYDKLRDHLDEREHYDKYQLPYKDGIVPGGHQAVFQQLLHCFDAEEPFMTDGNQKITVRTDVQRLHPTSEWMFNDKKVLDFLKKEFPNLGKCNNPNLACECMACRRLSRAAKWQVVIQTYFRMHMTESQIEGEYPWVTGQVENIIKHIQRAIRGLNRDGTTKTGKRRGRPRGWRKLHPIQDKQFVQDLAAD